MLDLKGLKELANKGLIRGLLQFDDPDDEDGVSINITMDYHPDHVFNLMSVEEGIIKIGERTFKIDDLCLFISVERMGRTRKKGRKTKKERASNRQWEKIKKQLRESGFVWQHGQPTWSNVWEEGSWGLKGII